MTKSKYRFENGSAYEFSASRNAYVFIGKLNGRTQKQFIRDYEQEQYNADDTGYDDTY